KLRTSGAVCSKSCKHGSNREVRGIIPAIDSTQALRKKILAAYKKFTKGGNPQEIQDRLIEGAKAYLESLAAPSS
ncbi:MAG: hypothetical protein V7L23_08390, partial [Nostoc sp.]|uniref:hypothetical protein n=1 Tax=Nostoc sp. TaxID=1180 RepID=UPI002FF09758